MKTLLVRRLLVHFCSRLSSTPNNSWEAAKAARRSVADKPKLTRYRKPCSRQAASIAWATLTWSGVASSPTNMPLSSKKGAKSIVGTCAIVGATFSIYVDKKGYGVNGKTFCCNGEDRLIKLLWFSKKNEKMKRSMFVQYCSEQ